MKTNLQKLSRDLGAYLLSIVVCLHLYHPLTLRADISSADKSFVKDEAEGGLAEVKMGDLAKQKAKSPEVKQYGEMLVTDHSKGNEELKSIAKAKGAEVPTTPSLIQQGKLKLLGLKKGAAFDKAFVEDAVQDHKTDIQAFEKATKDLNDADLKGFATKTLPTLKHHLAEAEKLNAKLEAK